MKTPMLLLLTFVGLTSLLTSCAPLPPSGTTSSGSTVSGPASSRNYTPIYANPWSGVTVAAAVGYCLAKHPYISNTSDRFTADGYERAGSPGIVGAVRRNYIFGRGQLETPPARDAGLGQTCQQACLEFGKAYGTPSRGRALRQQLSNGDLRTSGIGDMASLAETDHDYYMNIRTVAGIWSRANNFHEGGVEQADYCCCQVTSDPAP